MHRPATALALLLLSCREPAPTPAQTPPPAPPLVVGTTDAGATPKTDPTTRAEAGAPPARIPAALVHLAEEGEQRVLLGPFMWPPKGTSVFVGQLSLSFLWRGDGTEDRDAMPTDRTPTRAITKDVDGDGNPELVVFVAPITRPLESFEDKSTVWIFAVRPSDRRVARMSTLEYQLIGVNDERALDAELASLGKLEPTANVPVERIITRLAWATPDELRALIPAKGIQLCHRQAFRRGCSTIAKTSIDAKTTKKIVDKPGAFAKYVNEDFNGLQRPACEEKAKRITCSASVGGPEGGQWIFERRGNDLELVEIASWAEDT